ncbi:hypothetical protein FACS1894191_1300 [Clostridia bacterium]|nr:hypothetical protein FACS1894191_1300 [Clostridia bacterium]
MKYLGAGLSELHKELNAVIRKREELDNAKSLFLDLHAKLHLSESTGTESNEVDAILTDLSPDEYRIMPTDKDETIAWALWHLARIEDLTMNFLVAEGEQILNPEWKKDSTLRLTIPATLLEPIQNLLSSKTIKEITVIWRLVCSLRSQFFQSLRHLSSQPNVLSTTQRFGRTAN